MGLHFTVGILCPFCHQCAILSNIKVMMVMLKAKIIHYPLNMETSRSAITSINNTTLISLMLSNVYRFSSKEDLDTHAITVIMGVCMCVAV